MHRETYPADNLAQVAAVEEITSSSSMMKFQNLTELDCDIKVK